MIKNRKNSEKNKNNSLKNYLFKIITFLKLLSYRLN